MLPPCGVAPWTTLRKIFSSHGTQSLEAAVKSYSSRAWSSNALKRGCLSKLILITNLLQSSPTYTAKWPFGTSLGIELSSCMECHRAHRQQHSQAAEGNDCTSQHIDSSPEVKMCDVFG